MDLECKKRCKQVKKIALYTIIGWLILAIGGKTKHEYKINIP